MALPLRARATAPAPEGVHEEEGTEEDMHGPAAQKVAGDTKGQWTKSWDWMSQPGVKGTTQSGGGNWTEKEEVPSQDAATEDKSRRDVEK